MKDWKIPNEPDLHAPESTTVFAFPRQAPKGAVTREDVSALDHLALWSIYREYWTDHNPSVTINVREDEWLEVASWVYSNWDKVGGISFLPYSEHIYKQAPYTEVDADTYDIALAEFPKEVRWADLGLYELIDSTNGARELACAADNCEVVDLA
jgi:ribonucleoside-diphosphate reductase alpha chain